MEMVIITSVIEKEMNGVPGFLYMESTSRSNGTAGITVTFATVGGGSLTGGTQTTNAQGVATVGSWTIGAAVGTTYGLSATAAGVSGQVLFQTEAAAGAAGKVVITTQPSATAQSGVPLAQQPAIQLTDAAGNPVDASGVTVVASIGSGAGTLEGTTSVVTNTDGRAQFSDLKITGAAGARTLVFSASGLDPATSSEIAVGAGAVSESQSSAIAAPRCLRQRGPRYGNLAQFQRCGVLRRHGSHFGCQRFGFHDVHGNRERITYDYRVCRRRRHPDGRERDRPDHGRGRAVSRGVDAHDGNPDDPAWGIRPLRPFRRRCAVEPPGRREGGLRLGQGRHLLATRDDHESLRNGEHAVRAGCEWRARHPGTQREPCAGVCFALRDW